MLSRQNIRSLTTHKHIWFILKIKRKVSFLIRLWSQEGNSVTFLNTYVDNVMIKLCLGRKDVGLIERGCQSCSIFCPKVSNGLSLNAVAKFLWKYVWVWGRLVRQQYYSYFSCNTPHSYWSPTRWPELKCPAHKHTIAGPPHANKLNQRITETKTLSFQLRILSPLLSCPVETLARARRTVMSSTNYLWQDRSASVFVSVRTLNTDSLYRFFVPLKTRANTTSIWSHCVWGQLVPFTGSRAKMEGPHSPFLFKVTEVLPPICQDVPYLTKTRALPVKTEGHRDREERSSLLLLPKRANYRIPAGYGRQGSFCF